MGDASIEGNCISQTINFTDSRRIFSMDGLPTLIDIKDLDTARYDATIDYYSNLVSFIPDGGLRVAITKPNQGEIYPAAARVSTTRFIKYGRVSLYLKAPNLGGVVTTFIMMGMFLPDPDVDLSNADQRGGGNNFNNHRRN